MATEKQKDVLFALLEMTVESGHQPTLQELAERIGIRASSVDKHLQALERSGYVARIGRRAVRVLTLPSEMTLEMRLAGPHGELSRTLPDGA